MSSLNVDQPDLQPRATQFIEEMLKMIIKLIENECAYVSNNHVLFDVNSFEHYGKLSGRSLDEQIVEAKVKLLIIKKSRDFILWKPSNDDEPGWPSPWGRGRPGWHLECSAMSSKCLQTPFDIHCGGVDLTFSS